MSGTDERETGVAIPLHPHDGADGAAEAQRKPGCGLLGCLYGTMALFVLLLVGMIAVAMLREWPQPRVVPGQGNPPAAER